MPRTGSLGGGVDHGGVWHVPEIGVHVLTDVVGKDVIELGCGTAYFGAWLKRRGARRVLGIDVTPAQLETARELSREFGPGLELVEASAEAIPLADSRLRDKPGELESPYPSLDQ